MDFSTRLLHSGNEIDPATGAVSVPIYQVSTFAQSSLSQPGPYDYSRSGNPTRQALEETMAILEGGTRAFAFASGMAAICSVLCLLQSGDRVLATEDLYGGSYRALTRLFTRFGIQADFVATSDEMILEAALQAEPRPRLLFLETPSNPLLKITNLQRALARSRELGILSVVDSTFMTPYLQRPLELGADVVVHSATKYLAGHSDVVAGVAVVRDNNLAHELAFIQNAFGAIAGPQDSWLVLRGLKTLQVRLDRQQESAGKVAAWLKEHPLIREVFYPGLSDHPGHEVHHSQADGPGAIVSFRVTSPELAQRLLQRVKLPALAVSLGAVESLISYPYSMSHAALPPTRRQELGIGPDLIRLSLGLEAPHDLIADLAQALE